MNATRFVIITVPPPEVASAIHQARAEAGRLTGSVAALAYPPHLTLRSGVVVPLEDTPSFLEAFGACVGFWEPFSLRADGIVRSSYEAGDGAKRHLVAWHVEPSSALLGFHERLIGFVRYQRRPQPPFVPHLTIAYEDLGEQDAEVLLAHAAAPPEAFPPRLSWPCDNVALYRLIGGVWLPFHVYRHRPRS